LNILKLEGTLQAVEMTKGVLSNTYDSVGNADVKFRRNTTDFFYLKNNHVELNSGITLYSNSAKLDTINTVGNNDLVLQRNGVEYMKLEGTLQSVEMTKGAKSNTYDRIGNADVKFRRNTTDFFYLRNGQVELNSGITLYSNSAKSDTINTTGNNDLA
jgi:hypothetical protein